MVCELSELMIEIANIVARHYSVKPLMYKCLDKSS